MDKYMPEPIVLGMNGQNEHREVTRNGQKERHWLHKQLFKHIRYEEPR